MFDNLIQKLKKQGKIKKQKAGIVQIEALLKEAILDLREAKKISHIAERATYLLAYMAMLKASFELGKRQDLEPELKDFDIKDPQSVVKAIRASIKDKAKEHFKLILLNTRNKVIGISTVSIGTLNSNLVHPREVFKEAKKAVVEFTLPRDNEQIFARKYQLYLPSKEELKKQLED